jgi:superfamily II DNA or RNA helicase
MSRFDLRPYQTACVEAVLSKFRQHGKLLAVLPTAAGKTVIFSHTAEKFAPGRTLILAHREELLSQAADKLTRATGIVAETECGTRQASLDAQVVVASVQTLMGEKRLSRWPRDHFNLVVVDEAHHALAESYQRVLRHFDGHAKVLGVTATPDRGDKKNLGTYFEDIAFEIGLHELIEDGYLSRIAVRTLPVEINLTDVRTVAGDYNDADLGDVIEPGRLMSLRYTSPSVSAGPLDLIERARRYLAKMPPAVSGQHGHDQTFAVACTLVQGFGLAVADAAPLFAEYNARCSPRGPSLTSPTN